MLISCPKCSAVYKVDDAQIPADGKKFKCAECGEIWTVRPNEVKKIEPEKPAEAVAQNKATTSQAPLATVKTQIVRPETASDEDLQNMFNRISQDTKGLFSQQTDDTSWARFKRKLGMFFTPFMLNCTILLFIFAGAFIIGYVNRYDLVGYIPQLEHFYNQAGVESIYKGKNIEFRNLQLRQFHSGEHNYAEVSGILYNKGNIISALLPIKATLLNADGSVAAETTKTLLLRQLEPKFSAVFRIRFLNDTLEERKITLMLDKDALPQSAKKEKKVSDKE